MLTKRGLNKKAAFPTSLLFGIVFGVVGLALALYWIMGGFDFLSGVQKGLPAELEPIAQSCIFAAKASTVLSFCTFKDIEINKKTQYINCEYSEFDQTFELAQQEEALTLPTCNSDAEFKFCEDLDEQGLKSVENTKVNGQTCDFHGYGPLLISLTPATTGNVDIGSTTSITIKTERISTIRGNSNSANQALALSITPSSKGTLDKTAVITNDNGVGTVTFTATSAGDVTITAALASNPEKTGKLTIKVNAAPNSNLDGLG